MNKDVEEIFGKAPSSFDDWMEKLDEAMRYSVEKGKPEAIAFIDGATQASLITKELMEKEYDTTGEA
jgi:hypothetical protein